MTTTATKTPGQCRDELDRQMAFTEALMDAFGLEDLPECPACEARAWTVNACGSWCCAGCQSAIPAPFRRLVRAAWEAVSRGSWGRDEDEPGPDEDEPGPDEKETDRR